MTSQFGQPVTGRTEEIEQYVAEVREALADLPPAQLDELLEDLPTHLAEVAAEDPEPLVVRLGPPAEYAAELRAALDPAASGSSPSRRAYLLARWGQIQGRLRRLDVRIGPLIGYERFSDFARLLRPAWWLLRGYLAAMLVVLLLNQQGPVGLLPRLGGSTIAGLVILAGFLAGSIWLAHQSARLRRWQRRTVHIVSAILVLFGLAGLAGIDSSQRWGWPDAPIYVSDDPYGYISDVFVVDADGNLLTDVRLLDQDGAPIDIGSAWCDGTAEYDAQGEYWIRYPRCLEQLPWWAEQLLPGGEPTPTATPTTSPTPSPTPQPEISPSSTPSPTPTDDPDR